MLSKHNINICSKGATKVSILLARVLLGELWLWPRLKQSVPNDPLTVNYSSFSFTASVCFSYITCFSVHSKFSSLYLT